VDLILKPSRSLKKLRSRCAKTSSRWKRCPSHGSKNFKSSKLRSRKKRPRKERLKRPNSLEILKFLT